MTLTEAEELLPWAIAGTLSEDEARAVQAFIDSGEISPEQIAELEFLADTVQTVAAEEPQFNPAVIKNIVAKVDSVPQIKVAVPDFQRQARAVEKTGWLQKVADFLQLSLTPTWAKVTIAAQLSLIVGAVAIYYTQDQTTSNPNYGTAGGGPIKLGAGDFSVIFAPTSTAADIGNLLNEYHLTIVAGPSSIGAYTVAAEKNTDIDALKATLSEKSIINYVLPVEEP